MNKTSLQLIMIAGLIISSVSVCSAKIICDPKSPSGKYLSIETEDGGYILKVFNTRLGRMTGIDSSDYNDLDFTQKEGDSFTLKDSNIGLEMDINEAPGATSTLNCQDPISGNYTCSRD
jgi:hypothetical protein